MSSFQDARWLRRLWSLAAPGDPTAPFIANVQLVNDRSYGSSRERAPYAHHSAVAFGAGAGVHNFVEIGAIDGIGPTRNLLQQAIFEVGQANILTGVVRWVIADGAALTTATRVAVTPVISDNDPDITPVIFTGTIATANIPAAAATIPRTNGIGQTAATPSFPSAMTQLPPCAGLNFCASWLGPSNLLFFSGDNEFFAFVIAWQGMRE